MNEKIAYHIDPKRMPMRACAIQGVPGEYTPKEYAPPESQDGEPQNPKESRLVQKADKNIL